MTRSAKRAFQEPDDLIPKRPHSDCICGNCGCGILNHEERGMESMTGQFGCLLMYWHADPVACRRALLDRVRELEGVVADLSIQLRQAGLPEFATREETSRGT